MNENPLSDLEGTPALSWRSERAKDRIDQAHDAAAPTVAVAYVITSMPFAPNVTTELRTQMSDGRTFILASDIDDELVLASFDSAARELIGLTEHEARTFIAEASQ